MAVSHDLTTALVDARQSGAKCADPHLAIARTCERHDVSAVEPGPYIVSQRPTAGIPAAHARRACSDPEQATCILKDCVDVGVTEAVRIAGHVCVAVKSFAGAVEQVQAVGSAEPEATLAVLENDANVIVAEARRFSRVVAIVREVVAAIVEAIEPAR